MSVFFNSDGSFPLQFMIIFAVIFVVLAAIVLVFRRLSGKGMSLSSKTGPRGRQPRLGIVDIYELDRQRQLILLRRDNVEHLLLVGGPNDVIVERNINRGAGVRMPLEEAPRVEPASEDPIFEPARPADPAAAGAPPFQPKTFEQPAFEQPVFEAPERKAPPATASAAPVVVEEAAPQRDVPAEPKPNARPSRAEVIAARAARRNPPPLANLKPEVPDRQRPPSGGRAAGDVEPTFDAGEIATPVAPREETPPPAAERARERAAQPPAPVVEPPPVLPPVPPPIARPTSSRPVDAAILSDMARQLEEALRRPSAAVSPSSQAGAPVQPNVPSPPPPERRPQAEPKRDVAPVPEKAPAERAIDPMAAVMAASPEEPAAPAEAERKAPVPEPKPFLPPPPPPAPEPEAPAPRRAAAPSQNPFSVEEIEAEFARLLGRPLDKKN